MIEQLYLDLTEETNDTKVSRNFSGLPSSSGSVFPQL